MKTNYRECSHFSRPYSGVMAIGFRLNGGIRASGGMDQDVRLLGVQSGTTLKGSMEAHVHYWDAKWCSTRGQWQIKKQPTEASTSPKNTLGLSED